MIKYFSAIALLLFPTLFSCQPNPQNAGASPNAAKASLVSQKSNGNKIQVALLLDTSNSMDGLIDQAKAQLWKMVNRLADAQRQNQGVSLEIALYEYGNDGLNPETGFIRQVQPMNADLDGLSEQLFSVKTNGGSEFCGWVIQTALENLPWSDNDNDLKIIVIAGNEPFNQGKVDYRSVCQLAAKRQILINTIHCGDYETGVREFWKDGAEIGKGRYRIIDTDQKVVHINTPFDEKILECNKRLNKTYIGYGPDGESKKMRQESQDEKASTYGASNMAKRAAAKSKSVYKNEEWDMVDAAAKDKDFVNKVEEKNLPEAFKGKSKAEISAEIQRLTEERKVIKAELADLEKKMTAYIAEETKKMGQSENTLDQVLIQDVVEQAKAKGFTFED